MTNPAPTDTWAGVLFDGLLGAAVGAIATITVVVMTIRHERRLRERDRFDDAVALAHAEAGAFVMASVTGDLKNKDALPTLKRMMHAVTALVSRAQASEPQFAQLLQQASLRLSEATATADGSKQAGERVRAAGQLIYTAIGRWIVDPVLIRDEVLDFEQLQALVRVTNAGGEATDLGLRPLTRVQRFRRRLGID